MVALTECVPCKGTEEVMGGQVVNATSDGLRNGLLPKVPIQPSGRSGFTAKLVDWWAHANELHI